MMALMRHGQWLIAGGIPFSCGAGGATPTPSAKFARTAPPSTACVPSSHANEDHAAGNQDC
jgi:hypothetical protein